MAQLGAAAAATYTSRMRSSTEQTEMADAEEEKLWNQPLIEWVREHVEQAEENTRQQLGESLAAHVQE